MARATKKEPAKAAPPSVSYVSATVRPDEIYNPMKIAGNAQALVLRAVGEVAICAHKVATACASQPIKLYRKAKGVAPKSRKYRAVDPKVKAYLRGEKARKPGPMVLAATEGQDEFVEVLEHSVLQFMQRPNPGLPGYEWAYQRHLHQLTAGNAYAFLFADGVGVEAYPLLPQFVTIISSTEVLIDEYRYSRNRYKFQTIPPDQMMHQRFIPSSWSPMLGASPMEGIIPELDLYAAAVQAETARWSNGGQPPLAFTFPDGTSKEAIEAAQAQIQAQIRGVRKTGGHLFLAGGVAVSPTGLPAKDMEYVTGMDRIDQKTWRAFGVPESMAKLNDSNLASAVAGSPQFARETVAPRINADADCLTISILPLFGLDPSEYFFAADDPCVDDMGTNATTVKTLIDARVISVNEARGTYLDLPTRSEPEADKLPALPPAPTFGGGFPGSAPAKPEDKPASPVSTDPPEPPEPAEPGEKAWTKTFRARKLTKSGWHYQHVHTKEATDAGTPLTPDAQRASDALDRALVAWHEKAARLMADNPAVHRAALEAELQTILENHLSDIMRAGAADAAPLVGAEAATVAERGAADFIRSYTIRLRDSITAQFEQDINDAIRQAITDGATQSEAHAEVADIIGEQASYRAERIARTETSRALQEGALAAGKEAGWKKQLIPAGGCCPVCTELARRWPDPVDADTILWPVGSEAAGVVNTYMDFRVATFHPNDRCEVVPIPPELGEGMEDL